MIYVRWCVLAVANLTMLAVALVLAPVLPAFALSTGYLPRELWWFQTPDNSLDGDVSFQVLHALFPGAKSGWRRYLNRVWWLLRNPSYGFDLDVLGASVNSAPTIVGTLPLGGVLTKSGWYFARTGNAFQLYAVYVYGSRAARVNFGWKLWQAPGVCQFALTVNPFITFN